MKLVLISVLMFSMQAFSFPSKPNPALTYPDFCRQDSKDFKMIRYENVSICNRNVSTQTKRKVYDSYSIPETERSEYTIDHLIPLSMGGSNEIANLWPQHKSISTSDIEFKIFQSLEKAEIMYNDAIDQVLEIKIK